jgi:hypothetical protein
MRCCLAVLFFLSAAASFNGFYDKWHFREAGTAAFMPGASLEEMLDGTAARPYVERQLLPGMANAIDALVPASDQDRLFSVRLYSGRLFREEFIDSPMARDRQWFLRYWVMHTSVFLAAWLAVFAMHLFGRAAGVARAPAALAAMAMILAIPYFETRGGFFYDYPELAFLAIALWIALTFNWIWLIPLAALATWNKESFLFFVPALYPILRYRGGGPRAWVKTLLIGLASGAVYALLRARFVHNPGGSIEWHLPDQLDYMLHPLNMLTREKTYGLLMFQAFNPLLWALVAVAAWRGWSLLPRHLRRHALVAALINVPLYLLFCLPGELRNLSMLYPSLLLLLAANLNDWNLEDRGDITTQAATK